jgi:hypothetical protein
METEMTEFNKPTQEEDWGALAEKHLASIKRDMKISLEDAAVRAAHKVMTEFNDTERQAQQRKASVMAALENAEIRVTELKKRFDALSASRNETIEEVAQHIEKLKGFGQDTVSSLTIYIREMKK